MIAPQVSIANVAQTVTVVSSAAPPREVTPAGNSARVRSDNSNSGRTSSEAQVSGEDGKAQEPQGAQTAGRQLSDLGGERLAILHNDEADRFVYQSVNEESNEVERQYPSDEDLARIASFRELAGKVVDEIL